MIWYDMIWYDMILENFIIWYHMIWYDMIWYDMILENFIIWYHMISYDIIWYRNHMMSYHMILSYDMILENLLRTNPASHRQRIQNLRPLLSPWIVGVSGPILNQIKENKVLFLFVTDKYSSLINVSRTNKIVSNLKEWENMCHYILLTIPWNRIVCTLS